MSTPLPGTNPMVAVTLLLGASAPYALAFLVLGPLVGSPIMALLFVPLVVAGWSFGALGGGVAAAVLVLLNALLGLFGTTDSTRVPAYSLGFRHRIWRATAGRSLGRHGGDR